MGSRKWSDFKIENTLGEGGEGIIYHAKDLVSGRWVVLKVNKGTALDSVAAEVKKELATIISLDHPNVASIDHVFLREEEG